ncbi:MAG: hypothetical protein NC218_06100 [Acetobacter sp.]|nr:hypothetical protein [Acetobacter sp.]
MEGIKSFVIGFSLSLLSVSLGGQLFCSATANADKSPSLHHIKIDLFKSQNPIKQPEALGIFANVQKVSITDTDTQNSSIGAIPQANEDFAFSTSAPEDDEILSINIDGVIPIEFDNTPVTQKVEISHLDNNEISAMLPTNLEEESLDDISENDTPWAVVKGGRHIKNKKLLEEIEEQERGAIPQLADDFTLTLEDSEESSYRVAEKIKSSLLFPIPSEILNDENLTPTFIKKNKTPNKTIQKKQTSPKAAQKKEDLTIITKIPTPETEKEDTSKTLLGSITSWFTSSTPSEETTKQKKAPSYSSQEQTSTSKQQRPTNNNEFVNFYKTLQETSAAHQNNTIIPTELKLSFQPERAEISGQTLRWLKAFSEAAQDDATYLQIRLDVSASTELQRKRLNLLYTIFMNNGVDFKKIDTVFSLTEPNAFIIRTLKVQ